MPVRREQTHPTYQTHPTAPTSPTDSTSPTDPASPPSPTYQSCPTRPTRLFCDPGIELLFLLQPSGDRFGFAPGGKLSHTNAVDGRRATRRREDVGSIALRRESFRNRFGLRADVQRGDLHGVALARWFGRLCGRSRQTGRRLDLGGRRRAGCGAAPALRPGRAFVGLVLLVGLVGLAAAVGRRRPELLRR